MLKGQQLRVTETGKVEAVRCRGLHTTVPTWSHVRRTPVEIHGMQVETSYRPRVTETAACRREMPLAKSGSKPRKPETESSTAISCARGSLLDGSGRRRSNCKNSQTRRWKSRHQTRGMGCRQATCIPGLGNGVGSAMGCEAGNHVKLHADKSATQGDVVGMDGRSAGEWLG